MPPLSVFCHSPGTGFLTNLSAVSHNKLSRSSQQRCIASVAGHDSWVLGVDCHPDGTHIVSCGSDAKVKLWEMGTRALVQTQADHQDQVWVAKFSKDGTRLMTGADDGTLALFSVG